MNPLDLFTKNLASNFETLKQHLDDFTDADLMVRPVPAANHAAWQLGHLLVFEAMLCDIYAPKGAPKLPDGTKEMGGAEGSKSDDPAKFLKKAEVLKLLGQARSTLVGWVKTLSEADLQKPAPEQFRGWLATQGDLLLGILGHTTMHIGQIQVIRRKLGKKILF